jgi:hypothetical protein
MSDLRATCRSLDAGFCQNPEIILTFWIGSSGFRLFAHPGSGPVSVKRLDYMVLNFRSSSRHASLNSFKGSSAPLSFN